MTEQIVGVVVIGRNEGERLKRCLGSIQKQHSGPVVYVDSGSTDGSAVYARSIGVEVVDLDISIPFTMARGRNAGLKQLVKKYPQCHFVQFIEVGMPYFFSSKDCLVETEDKVTTIGIHLFPTLIDKLRRHTSIPE